MRSFPLCCLLFAVLVLAACAPTDRVAPAVDSEVATRGLAIAQEYVDGYYLQFPEECHLFGYPDAAPERLGDQNQEALASWYRQEDAWLEELSAMDSDALIGTPAEIPAAYALERLQASVELRACRGELWNVNPTWRGLQVNLPGVFSRQAVATESDRAALLARARDIPRYVDVEISNLERGIEGGYVAPRCAVDAVLRQLEALVATPVEDSPFLEPARRANDEAFAAELKTAVAADILPAMARYRDFLEQEYLAAARDTFGVGDTPGGRACYKAAVRNYTALQIEPEEIHRLGQEEMVVIEEEMAEIARRAFDTDDVKEVLALVRSDPRYTFGSEQEILDCVNGSVTRARQVLPELFGFVPTTELKVEPFPAFQKRTGSGLYRAGAGGTDQPGLFQLGTYAPATLSRAGLESTAFHETYPGHHLQFSIGRERGAHPLLNYFFSSGFGEGWALYAERLADEQGLFSSDVDRLGLLSNEALRAARLVVDSGLHVLGWSRQQAIDYLLEHTAESEGGAAAEIDRYIMVPGQATSYLLGAMEIRQLRAAAEERLGDSFDIRDFHDHLLADGTVTLGIARTTMERWLEERAAALE